MSRKPPKLAPIEGKELSSGSGKTPDFAPPPLKHCGDVGANNAAVTPTPRRSSLTRHFLNCNGSTPGTRRRFQPKASAVEAKAAAPSSPSPARSIIATSNDNGSDTNGVMEGKAPTAHKIPAAGNSSATKVNGTMANGVGCAKSSDPPKLIKRSAKSLGSNSESSANSNSDSQGSSVTVNGKKTESVEPRPSVSNSTGSQNNSSISAVKRTSRFSQSSVAVQSPKLTTCGAVPASSTREDKTMPALVACEPTIISTEENSRESLELNSDGNSVKTDESISEEPKIIRKGDTVIKSYVDEKTGRITVFERGMKLEVCDFGSGKWYPAKVMNIDWEKQEILVHYSNWSSRYDEWISMKSSRVRPGKNTNVVRLQFVIGERVEAVWPMDSHRYRGTVTQQLPQDCYEVTFDDGIKLKRSAHQLFKVNGDEEPPKLVTSQMETPSEEIKETKTTSPPTLLKKRRKKSAPTPVAPSPKLPETPTKVSDNVADDGTPIAPNDALGGPRPTHFSVFDLPSGDLGKRRRTVNDYAALVNVRRRGPNMKGPRRPKSEGSGLNSNALMSTDDISADDTELTSTESVINETTEPEVVEPTKRRQKSGSTTHVPTNQQPSSDIPKELPSAEPISVEPILPSPPPVNDTPKKRKQTANVPSANTNVEIKVPLKPEITQIESVQPVPSASASTTTTVARRTKSLSTIQLGVFPPLTDSDTPNDTKVDSGFVDELGTAIIIEQNNVDGFWKCPLNECRKNFRKDSLLKMHFKHYHPELKVANARGIANVVQMAQARTAFDNDPGDYYAWPKFTCPEPTVTPEASTSISEASKTNHEVPSSSETPDTSHKKTPKGIHLHKTPTPTPKVSPVAAAATADLTSPTGSVKNSEVSPKDASKTPIRSPRLRLNRKRNFVLTKYGRIRASKKLKPSAPLSNEAQKDENSSDSMVTESYKKVKPSETSESCEDASFEPRDDSVNIASPKSSLPTTSTTSSPSVSDHFSVESFTGSSSGDPVFPASCTETESQPTLGSRIPKSRWSKAHIRRGLMSSNVRRVGSGKLQNSTTLFLRKRMQLRKFMGKRGSRQKRTSILSRISSGRMRVILDALNQRSLRRQRFRAHRRYRDVKVDVINCVCSSKTEFGLMIQCELCLCWQHGSCFNVQSNSQLSDFYACQSCSEPEKVRLSRKYEWAESEFYRLGKLPSFPFAPRFSKEDARIMKMCTNLSSNLIEAYSMIKGLKLKERICFGQPEHPQLYEWNTERPPPQEEIQKDRFNKYFKPVLRRLLLENKSDSVYHTKLRTLAEARMKLRKYSDAVESARSTLKKKLGCRAAAFLDHICDSVMNDMVRAKRRAVAEDNIKMENLDLRKRATAEQAYNRLLKVREEVLKNPDGPPVGDDKFPSFYNGTNYTSGSQIPTNSLNNYMISNHLNIPVQQSSIMLVNHVSQKGGASNGLRDSSLHVKDFCFLKKYMKERRTVETIISLMLTRMSKEFPEDWKNLMKISRGFIDESSKDSYQDAKMKWISSVIVTFNTLRILLMQIYSENNAQKQTKLCLDFERTTIKLFDLFGIGLAEERVGTKKQHASNSRCKRVRGLETVDMLGQPNSPSIVKSREINPKLTAELDDASKEILKRLGTSSKPLSNKDVEDLLTAASETKRFEEDTTYSANVGINMTSSQNTKESKHHSSTTSQSGLHTQSTDMFSRARKPDGQIAFDFSNDVQLLEAVKVAGDIPQDECTEENLSLEFTEPSSESLPSSHTGILAVPADSRITPDKCKKNLVRDILLQQQQIDVYLDKIEAQIIKLTSQSRSGGVVINMKPAELSVQRTRMLQSLELVTRLSKTVIGENDVVETTQSEDMDVSETTLSDYSDMDISSESDGFDNASNFSGTDTETADEGDDLTGFDDDLLDV